MTTAYPNESEVIVDRLSAKLAATQLQLLDLAEKLDAYHLSTHGQSPDPEDVLDETVYAENERLMREVSEWQAFKLSRTYRLNQKYAQLYEKPAIGSILRSARRVVAKFLRR